MSQERKRNINYMFSHFFNQSEVKPKPIVAHACTFSHSLCRLRVMTSNLDWFTGLSPSFLIGQSNRPFATNDHMVQNPPCWRASLLLFPHWDIKTKRPELVKLDLPLF